MKKGIFFKKGLAMLLAVVMIIGFLPGVGSLEVSAAEGSTIALSKPEGDGTAEKPYQIGTAEELYWFADKVNNENKTYREKNAVLTADITVNTGVLNENGELASNTNGFVKWTPIGNTSKCNFRGTFDGQNYTISGLYFDDKNADYVGLIGYLYSGSALNASASNVNVVDSYFNGKNYVGSVCGRMFDSTMSDCHNAGNVNGVENVGGVVGECDGETKNIPIQKCYNTGIVTGTNYVGGVCGYFKNGTITACYNTGKVDGSENIGGVCGYLESCIMNKCYFDKAYANNVIGNYDPDSDVEIDNDVHAKTTKEMHQADFCTLIGYHSYQNEKCSLCSAYQEAVLTKDKYDINGDNEKDEVYEIGSVGQLYWFADKVNNDFTYQSANAVLTKDIVVNKNVLKPDGTLNEGSFKDWTPIGSTENYKYQGTFDGQKHTISGLYFNNGGEMYVGLIGYLGEKGKITNVGVKDSYFEGDIFIGGVCGYNENGRIENCYYAGDVSGYQYVGGVCGYNENATVKNCYNTGNVKVTSLGAGGVCGWIDGGTIENCYNTGKVSGPQHVGGIYGGYTASRTIKNCYYNIDTGTGYDSETIGKTTDEFKSGEVAYLLQKGQEAQTEVVWGQKIGSDNSPVLRGSKVYKKSKFSGCEGQPGDKVSDIYTNEDKDVYAHHTDDGSNGQKAYDNICDVCGKTAHHFVNGICDAKDCGYHQGVITNVSYKTKIVYSGDVANAEPKVGDFTVNSGQALTFNWYQRDVTTDNLPKNSLGAAPKEAGTYTLVVNAEGAEKDGIVYTAAERRIKVTIEKEPIKNTETEPKKEESSTQQPSDTTTAQQPSGTTEVQPTEGSTVSQPPKNGDVIADDKTKAKFEVTDVTKKEVTYNAPADEKTKDIIVPDNVTINGEVYKVTKVSDNAFKGNKTVTSITIGSNIQTIGKNAFKGCKKLKTIIIQSKTLMDKKISKKAFKGISKKTVIKVPKKKLAAYKKLLKKKGLSSKNKVKGY